MRIKQIAIKNFKVHQNLELIILNRQNCLIYGENGSGKSSIYWALYSIFKIYLRNHNFDFQKFKNIDIDSLSVEVQVDNHLLKIPNTNYNLPQNIDLENANTVYFANQNLLNEIINSSDENFYNSISLHLRKYFQTLNSIYKNYENIKITLTATNHIEKIEEAKSINNIFEKILNQIELRANDIIQNHFKEDFELGLEFEAIGIDSSNLKFQNPQITILINDKDSLDLYFNEAKLKLASIAIFFALIKIEEKKQNPLKLLVLDDFLTSLDMANRHYIIEYIFKNFKKYQIILLTHNLQFYNLILEWLNTNKQESRWDIKNIYIRKNGNQEESIVYESSTNYIHEAKEKLRANELSTCGNLIRKEFERIIHELEKLYKLGKKEQTSNIVDLIIYNKPIYTNQQRLLDEILPKIKDCQNRTNNMERNKEDIKEILNSIDTTQPSCNSHLKAILESLSFYRKIVLNRASHNNPEAEIYRREYHNSIRVIEELNMLLKYLKKDT